MGFRRSVPIGWKGKLRVRGYVCCAGEAGTTWTAGGCKGDCGVHVVGSVMCNVRGVAVVGSVDGVIVNNSDADGSTCGMALVSVGMV